LTHHAVINHTDTFDIAAHLADRIVNYSAVYKPTESDLRYMIERELDKYVERGEIRLQKVERG
jgi:hypothetical protein